jgi:hypothetical protein
MPTIKIIGVIMGKETEKAKTYQERMGFKDQDIKTSKHDEICLWLAKQSNCEIVLKDLNISQLFSRSFINDGYRYIGWDWEKEEVIRKPDSDHWAYNERYDEKIFNEIKEYIKNSFKDLQTNMTPTKFQISFEKPIVGRNSFMLGFIDVSIEPENKNYEDDYFKFERKFKFNREKYLKIYIEVKSSLPSFGEIVREINFYKEHLEFEKDMYGSIIGKGLFIVVAPECNFIEQLKEQGILFYKYKGDEI